MSHNQTPVPGESAMSRPDPVIEAQNKLVYETLKEQGKIPPSAFGQWILVNKDGIYFTSNRYGNFVLLQIYIYFH